LLLAANVTFTLAAASTASLRSFVP
jgi:hypothetical protein